MTEKPEEGRRSVIYARVSTDDKGQTTDTQVRICTEFCESKGHNILEVYTDEQSGSNLDRPGFNRMLGRITFQKDVDYVVIYDQSRLTRGGDFDQIKETFAQYRCYIRLASMDIDLNSLAGAVITANTGIYDKHENTVRNEKTGLGIYQQKLNGVHVGRPARFMFAEDIPHAPRGRFVQGKTTVASEEYIFGLAHKGYTIPYVAKRILLIGVTTLKEEMMPCVWEHVEEQPYARPDRLSAYRAIFESVQNALGDQRKGYPTERVEKPDETPTERVVA